MKRLAVLALAALLILPVYAHGGRTDANGGHYDSSTGEYHYHHGYPAHQHVNGTCPYNFDDKTDRNNDSSGGTAQNQVSKSNSDDGRTVIPSEIIWGCIAVIGCLFGILFLVSAIVYIGLLVISIFWSIKEKINRK